MNLNLHKAQKFLTSLNKGLSSININTNISMNYDITENGNSIIAKANEKIVEAKLKFDSYKAILEDINSLKNTIFEKNMKNGNHSIITELNFLKKILSLLKNIESQYAYSDGKSIQNVSVDQLDQKIVFMKENGSEKSNIIFKSFEESDIKKDIKKYVQRIEVLEDTLSKNNINDEISFEFSNASKIVLNLD